MDQDPNLHHGQQPASYEPAEPELNLQHYWHVILERRWLVLASFVSVLALALIYIFKAPEIYQAQARLQINQQYQNILEGSQGLAVSSQDEDYLQTQYKNLKSRPVIEAVIQKLNLGQTERYAGVVNTNEAVRSDITVAPIRSSRLVDVKVEHTDPQMARKIANVLVETFTDRNLEKRQKELISRIEYLTQRASNVQSDLTAAKQEAFRYKTTNNMPSLEEKANIVSEELATVQKQLTTAQGTAAEKEAMAQQVKEMYENEDVPVEAIPRISTDERVIKLQATMAERQSELDALLQTYMPGHPEVRKLTNVISSLKRSIDNIAKQIYRTIQLEAQAAQHTVTNLRALVEQKQQKQTQLSKLRINYDPLESDVERKEMIYNQILKSIEEIKVAAKSKSNNISIEEFPVTPNVPIKPRVSLILLMGVVGGAAAGVGLALFVNYLDDSIKSQDDVETYLRLPFLGYVPHIKTNSVVEMGLQAHVNPQSAVSESFRSLRAVVSLMPQADRYKVLTVTSTTPSEGKSVVTSNLAVVFAQTGLKTLIIDADLRRPALHKTFRLHSPNGLGAYLKESIEHSDEIIQNSEVANLDVVCCGPPPSSPSELITSKRMKEFIERQRNHYDRILLDCAPVTAVADPLVLASRSDGVVFVTKFNQIRRDHARKTVQRIQEAGIQILGVAINDIDFEGKDSYYYYYYYYQNRYYSDYYQPSSSRDQSDEEAPVKNA